MNVIPSLGLGTYRLMGQQVTESVSAALELGYRHIDTAQLYDNEADVGKAVAESGIARDELFITTKVWTDRLAEGQVMASLKESLNRLQMDRVDLTLIHWPSPGDEVPLNVYMAELLDAKEQGLTRHIGVSNFTILHLKQLEDSIGLDQIATNQVEIHPFLQNRKLVNFAREKGLHLTAYMPLACGKVAQEPLLQRIAEEHDASPAQITLAWLLQQGFAVIPSSTKRSHLQSNLAARDVHLTDDDVRAIEALDRNERIANPPLAPEWD